LSSLLLYAGAALVYMLAGRAFMSPGVHMRSSVLIIAAFLFGPQAALAVTLPDCNAIKAWAAPVTPPADFRNAAELERARGQVFTLLESPATATTFGSPQNAWTDRERAEVRQHLNYCQQALRQTRDPGGSARVAFVMTTLPERQTLRSSSPMPQSKREYLAQNPRAAPVPRNPNASTDLISPLETLGVRPGMTLTATRAAAAQWGARIGEPVAGGFNVNAEPDGPAYRGPPPTQSTGVVGMRLFPLDPTGDTNDSDRLVIYHVSLQLPGRVLRTTPDVPGLPLTELIAQGQQRLGRPLRVANTTQTPNRADCAYAVPDYANRVHVALNSEIRKLFPHLAAWKACGTISVLTQMTDRGDGLISGYTIVHSDAALAERAYTALREVARQREGQP
jgi:hypothetical protein